VLSLANNQILDINVLVKLENLEKLWLNNNQIADINVLAKLEKLTVLSLNNNQIADINVLTNLKKLTELYFNNNQIADINVLAKLEKLTKLSLDNNQIADINVLAKLEKLTELYLNNNQIADINVLAKLEKLTVLSLANNQILDINVLVKLEKLTTLGLGKNQIADISVLAKLEKLTWLDLDNNQIANINVLAKLEKLTVLSLDNNQISDINVLAKLEKLTELYLNNNQIADINVLAKLEKLTVLSLTNNQISDINVLAKLEKLTRLGLANNQIADISVLAKLEKLTVLGLANNQIIDISVLTKLKNLARLDLNGLALSEKEMIKLVENESLILHFDENTSIENVPNKVWKGKDGADLTKTLRAYFAATAEWQEEEDLLEAKMILLGDPNVGKTSLLHRLLDLMQPEPKTRPLYQGGATHDINMGEWQFGLEGNKQFKVNIFDFGGDLRLLPVHKYFLADSNCVYVLMINERDFNNKEEYFDDWLPMLRFYAKNAPLLVLFNSHEKEAALRNWGQAGELQDAKELYKIDSFMSTNLETYANFENVVEKLKTMLQEQVGKRKKMWAEVRGKMSETQESYVAVDDFENWCSDRGDDAKILLGLFHNLGYCFYFERFEKLRDYIFPKKDWLVKAVYAILWNKTEEQTRKKFIKDDFNALLKTIENQQYKTKDYEILLKCFEDFKLAYSLKEKDENGNLMYITQAYLPYSKPTGFRHLWEMGESLRLRLDFEGFMPYNIVFSLMAKFSRKVKQDSQGNFIQWQKGTQFDFTTYEVEVVETRNSDHKRLDITVAGADMAHGFRDFKNELEDSLKEMENFVPLQYESQVACLCNRCQWQQEPYYFDIEQELQDALTNGERESNCKKVRNKWEKISIIPLLKHYALPTTVKYIDLVKKELNTHQRAGFLLKAEVMDKLAEGLENLDNRNYGTAIHALALALENELRNLFAINFYQYVENKYGVGHQYDTEEAKTAGKIEDIKKQYGVLLRYVNSLLNTNLAKKEDLTLNNAVHSIELLQKQDAKTLSLCKDFWEFVGRNFWETEFNDFCTQLLADRLKLTDFRNSANHRITETLDKSTEEKNAKEYKGLVFDLLRKWLAARR